MHCILTTIKDGKFNYSGYVNGRNDLRALQDSFYERVAEFDLQRGEKVELTGSTYKSNKEWNRNVSQARSYVEALGEEERMDYAIQGILSKIENESVMNKINEYSAKNKELEDKYKTLKEDFDALININKKELGNSRIDILRAIDNERIASKISEEEFWERVEIPKIEEFTIT